MFDCDRLKRTLIVSCQAPTGSPMDRPEFIVAMAEAAAAGGAGGLRVDQPGLIAAVKATVALPVIGLLKRRSPYHSVYITASFDDAVLVAAAGADLIAVDATTRDRPGGGNARDLIARIRDELDIAVVADVDSFDAACFAEEAGANLLATTLAGYTGEGSADPPNLPDLGLVRQVSQNLATRVVAEGRYRRPDQLAEAFHAGAFAVTVGEAITNPMATTKRFVDAIPR